jgi:hypothetical protein
MIDDMPKGRRQVAPWDQRRKEPVMSYNMVVWSCAAAGCSSPRFLNDPQGRSDHQTAYGHAPVPGRPLGWAWDRGAA